MNFLYVEIAQQRNYNRKSEQLLADEGFHSLNNDQKDAFHWMWNSIANNEGKIFFIDGPGGTGKTYLYELICHVMQAQALIVLHVASTGLACLLLPGGQTAQSMFKIPTIPLTLIPSATSQKKAFEQIFCEQLTL